MKAARTLRHSAATAVVDRLRAAVSHPPGLEASPTGRAPRSVRCPRWDLQPLVVIMLAMTWAAGDSQAEKFETARGFYVACHEARKRPGKTLQGFQKALGRVPLRQFRALAAGVRDQIRRRFAERLLVDGFEPMGCDGSRIECPRSAELEARLGPAGKDDAAPTLWVTAFVHLATGLLWSWQLGPGTADEQVAPAAACWRRSRPRPWSSATRPTWATSWPGPSSQTERSFLLRMSSKVHLYTLEEATLRTGAKAPSSTGRSTPRRKGAHRSPAA